MFLSLKKNQYKILRKPRLSGVKLLFQDDKVMLKAGSVSGLEAWGAFHNTASMQVGIELCKFHCLVTAPDSATISAWLGRPAAIPLQPLPL